uniref:DUF1768 domain-containing protein n=1 Tax=Rhabditophanes sp. KR3021 TaxID=114890 RepID=A0AC35U8R3_9BILA
MDPKTPDEPKEIRKRIIYDISHNLTTPTEPIKKIRKRSISNDNLFTKNKPIKLSTRKCVISSGNSSTANESIKKTRKRAPSNDSDNLSKDDVKPNQKTSTAAKPEVKINIERNEQGESFVCFYSKNSVFSNHYPCSFTVDDIQFNCSEQYFIYGKAITFKDKKMAKDILMENDPVKQKRLGRKVKDFDKVVWDKEGYNCMKRGLKAKFSQNKDLEEILLSTKDAFIVECAARDRLWGIGCGISNPDRLNRKAWKGQNLLGKVLMEVRSSLSKQK